MARVVQVAQENAPGATARHDRTARGEPMSVARVTELSCTSSESFEDAIRQGIERATKTLRQVRSAWVKEERVNVGRDGAIEFQVNILVTFVLED
jgi:dodecin